MNEILLNSVRYEVKGEIVSRAINPWIAKVSSGGTTYDDASNAQLEEYHDFRNGIGKVRGVGSDARLQFSEGIDFTTEGQAVLGGLVTTAGSFGAAPVKIFDFQGNTYAISASTIKNWDNTSAWDTVTAGISMVVCDAAWDTEQGANVVCSADTSDYKEGTASAKMVVAGAIGGSANIASEGITEVDISGETEIAFWCKSSVALDAADWSFSIYDGAAILENIAIPALTANTWTHVRLTIVDPSDMTAVDKLYIRQDVDKAALSFWIDDIHAGGKVIGSYIDAIAVTDTTDEYLVISSADSAIYSTDGATWFDLVGCQGYLAYYSTKLRSIATDGITLYSSAANNIDGTWTSFTLSGRFGTVYDMTEGKLLADGTPALYFSGTEGVFTIDVTNEIAYQQEVEYPPLTYAGHKILYWNANVWVATGFGILKITPSLATFVGPDLDDGLPATYQGSVFDMTTVNNWLVYCVNKTASTDKSSIFKRNSSYGGSLQVYTSAANTAIACLHHSPSSQYTNGRLWWGEGTGIKYMMFPDTTSNVKQISTYTYVDDSGYGTLPTFRKLAVIPKVALGVGAITKSCVSAATEYIQVFYGLNGAAATTSLGTFLTSPHPTILKFNSGAGTEFYTIQFAIKLFRATASTTNSPELESLLFYYLPRPAVINAWTFNIVATDENSEATITALEAIRDTKTLVVFNETGDSAKTSFDHYVALSTMPLQFHVDNIGTRQGVIQVTVETVFSG